MRPSPSSSRYFFVCITLFVLSAISVAQQPAAPSLPVQPRITQVPDETQLTTLRGNTHPLARAAFDRGAAPASMPLERMLLVLKRSPGQESELTRLLDEQQDKGSPIYHKWLTPEEFGKRFGPADADIQSVTTWLQTHGFQVNNVSKGRAVIEFSGTADMVQTAFHTQIHQYVVGGAAHWANATDPQIPAAFTPVVGGVWSMHNFRKKPTLRMSQEHFPLTYPAGSSKPVATAPGGFHFLSPGDFSLIYGINPVYQAGINGNGASIAVIGRSNFNYVDVYDFHSIFGLPGPNLTFALNGPDPGNLGGGEEAEAVLDATWSSSIAPSALTVFVLSSSTDTTDGVDLSALYAVDNNLADVMTESFGICEAFVSNAEKTGFSALAEQAAAQGITYIVSSGDTGSAGCDNLGETTATGPISVNALASTPFNVAVGGTIFNESGHPSTYWSASTTAPVTALKYIPENVWNESCTSATCGNNANIAAGGGGPSSFFPKPNWQTGSNLHIPNDGFRDIPDVSLTAALHDPYLLCLAGSCSQQGFLIGIGGTSASAPSFAGIMALVNQKLAQVNQSGSGRVGNANYALYRLANAQTLSQCNASSTTTSPASTCVFNDVTVGNNAVPGEPTNTKFTAAVGYDLATGLGSVKVNNLLNAWAAINYNSTTTALTLTPSPTTITHGAAVQANITVSPASGSVKPTGDVTLLASGTTGEPKGIGVFHLSNGSVAATTNALPGGSVYNVTAHYAGDGTFAPSDSDPAQVTVNPEPSTTTIKVLTADSQGFPIPFTSGPYGSFVYLRADVAGNSGFGTPTGLVWFTDNGVILDGGTQHFLNSQGNTATPNGYPYLVPGSHSIAASYNGDASFNSSTSGPANITITKAVTSISVKSASATIASGSAVNLTATVDTTSEGASPAGIVAFFNGGTQLGTSGLGSVVNPSTGYAQATTNFQATSLPNGANSITAQYMSDGNYIGSTSAAITVNVAADFSLAFSDTSGSVLTITGPGSSGSLTLNVVGQTGYNGTVNFAAAACKGLPFGAACHFNPTSVTGSGSTTLSVSTTAAHLAVPAEAVAGIGVLGTSSVAFAGILIVGIPRRKRRSASAIGLLLLALLMTLVGCGGSDSSSGGGGGGTPGTPKGSYTVTVTGADANFSHPVTFTLKVQ